MDVISVITQQQIIATEGKIKADELNGQVVVSKVEARCLASLRKLIKEDEVLRDMGMEADTQFLLAFVRGKKCNSEKADKTELSPRKWIYLKDAAPKIGAVLKNPDREGCRVAFVRCSCYNPRIHKGEDAIEMAVTFGMELLRTENAPRNGLVCVVDATGFGFRHAREITMSRIYMFLQIFLSSYPIKYKGFHILNNAFLFDTILTLVKQLIPKKLRDRIHLHGSSYESLHKYVPREILPECFGGLLPECEACDLDFEQSILDKTEYYEKMARYW